MTALYELVMSDSDYEIRSAQSRYTETEEETTRLPAGETDYLTVSIRYKDPDGETSRLQELPVKASVEMEEMSDNMSWAAGVAQAGMLLRGSEFAGDSDYDTVRSRLRELTGGDEFREEFIYLLGRIS